MISRFLSQVFIISGFWQPGEIYLYLKIDEDVVISGIYWCCHLQRNIFFLYYFLCYICYVVVFFFLAVGSELLSSILFLSESFILSVLYLFFSLFCLFYISCSCTVYHYNPYLICYIFFLSLILSCPYSIHGSRQKTLILSIAIITLYFCNVLHLFFLFLSYFCISLHAWITLRDIHILFHNTLLLKPCPRCKIRKLTISYL